MATVTPNAEPQKIQVTAGGVLEEFSKTQGVHATQQERRWFNGMLRTRAEVSGIYGALGIEVWQTNPLEEEVSDQWLDWKKEVKRFSGVWAASSPNAGLRACSIKEDKLTFVFDGSDSHICFCRARVSNKLSHFRFSRGNENYVAEIKDGKLYLESNDAPWEKATWQQLRAFKRSDLRKTARTLAADDEVDKALDLEGENGQVNLDGLTALILYYSLSFSEARNQAEALAPREEVDIAMDEESPKSALIALMAAKAQNEDVGKVVASFLRSVNETISVSGSKVEATKNSVRSAKSAPSPTAAYTSNPTMGAMAGYASPMILSQGNTFDSMMEENLRPVTALSPFPENFSPYAAFMKDDFKTFVPDLDSVRAFDPDGYYGDFLPNGSLKTPGTPPGIGVVVYESKYIKRGVFVGQVAQGGIMWEGVVYSNGRGIFSIQPKDTGPQWTHLEPTLEAKYPFVKEFSWVQDDLPTGEGDSETNTTVMMRGFPCNLTRTGLLDQIFEFGFKKSFDFLYLPIDNTKAANKGYAFINLVNREELARFYKTFTGYRQWKNADGSTFKSKKVTWMSWAEMQGQEASINRYRNSPVMLDAEEHKPVVFKDGVQDVFPGPTKRIRENKKKDKA